MRRTWAGLVTAAVVASTAAIGVPAVPASAAPSWVVTTLRPLADGQYTSPVDVNAAGQAVGYSGTTPVRWSVDGTPTALAAPPGCTQLEASAINDSGVVAGWAGCPGAPLTGVEWAPDGSVSVLEHPLFGFDLSNTGVIVGQRHPGGDAALETAFAYVPGHPRIDLESAGGRSQATSVNDWGYVVGDVSFDAQVSPSIAVGWYGPYVFPLTDSARPSRAVDVNQAGVALVELETYVEGGAVVPSSDVLVYPGGTVVPATSGGTADRVVDLNDYGVEVGARSSGSTSTPGYFVGDAFVPFDQVAVPGDGPAWSGRYPEKVNDSGWVIGGTTGNVTAATRAWLLHPAS